MRVQLTLTNYLFPIGTKETLTVHTNHWNDFSNAHLDCIYSTSVYYTIYIPHTHVWFVSVYMCVCVCIHTHTRIYIYTYTHIYSIQWASQVAQVVKNPSTNAGDKRDASSIPGLGRSPGVGNGNPLQYSCLENSMDRKGWWATVHGAAESDRAEWLTTST